MPNPIQQITITLNDDATIGVNGPLDNKVLFYGLCDVAKEICYEHNKKAEQRVQPAPLGLVIPRN